MAKYAKWIGGGLGWAFFGPLGGVLGFLLGSVIDSTKVQYLEPGQTTRGDFMLSLLVLVATVMKADGKVVRSELDFVKSYMVQAFGLEAAQEAIGMLRDILKQEIPLRQVTLQIRQHLDYPTRLQLLQMLHGISMSDGQVHPEEQAAIQNIAVLLGISDKDGESIKSMFVKDTDWAYKILEINRDTSNEEVKKAYRKLAVKYHPDKVTYLGEDFQKVANEKLKKLNEAYEVIKKERNIK